MDNITSLEKIFSALGNRRRLMILALIEKGISNPGEISSKMKISRSTIEKHIRVLKEANIIEKVPGLTLKGNLRIYYKINEKIEEFLDHALNILNGFWL